MARDLQRQTTDQEDRMRAMSPRQKAVYTYLQENEVATSHMLANLLNCPTASIRRTIQVLRRRGINIPRLSTSRTNRQVYRLYPSDTYVTN